MRYEKIKDKMVYNGSQIKPFWALQKLKLKGSSIISWIGPMDIVPDELIDFEDAGHEIKSDEMIHFIIEHFDVQPADIKTCYHRQRIFVMLVKDKLFELGIETLRKGDDIYFKGGKLSVSIATCSNSSMKVHFGMNITGKGTPQDIEAIGLLECGEDWNYEKIDILADEICKSYIYEIGSIEEDITKTKVF